MKPLDENDTRRAARDVCKTIQSLGAPWGPNEAFCSGVKYAEAKYREYILQLEAEIHELNRKVKDAK